MGTQGYLKDRLWVPRVILKIGYGADYRRVVNVADPVNAHDAVTLGYLQNNYSTSSVIAQLSTEIDALNKEMASLNQSSGTATASAAAAETASTATSGQATASSVGGSGAPTTVASVGSGSAASAPTSSGSGTTVAQAGADSPVPAAPADTSSQQAAVTQANQYTDQQTQEALKSANTYTDAANAQTLSAANAYTDQALTGYVTTDQFSQFQSQVNLEFQQQNKRIDTLGAMSAASTQMAINTAGLSGDNRIGVGLGTYGGKQAGSIGYQHMFSNQKASFSAGVSSGGGETSGGVGVGFSW